MKSLLLSLLLLWILFPLGFAYGQQHVFVTTSPPSLFGAPRIALASTDLSNCTSHYIDTLPIGMFNIAFTPNGKLWAMENDTVGANLYQVDTSTGSVIFAGHFDSHGDYLNSMGVLNDAVLLIQCHGDLYGLTTSNVHSFRIGTIGNYRHGDMTWLGQSLYVTGITGTNEDSMVLIKVTFNNNSYPPIANAALVSNMLSLPRCFGLATVILPNTDTALIGFADSNTYIIDPLNGSYQLYCSIFPDSLGRSADAASISYPSIPIIIDTANTNDIVNPWNNKPMVKMYPNPVSHELNVRYESDTKATLILTDITGRTMLHQQLVKGIQQIDLTQLTAGPYIAILQTEGMTMYRQKILKE